MQQMKSMQRPILPCEVRQQHPKVPTSPRVFRLTVACSCHWILMTVSWLMHLSGERLHRWAGEDRWLRWSAACLSSHRRHPEMFFWCFLWRHHSGLRPFLSLAPSFGFSLSAASEVVEIRLQQVPKIFSFFPTHLKSICGQSAISCRLAHSGTRSAQLGLLLPANRVLMDSGDSDWITCFQDSGPFITDANLTVGFTLRLQWEKMYYLKSFF